MNIINEIIVTKIDSFHNDSIFSRLVLSPISLRIGYNDNDEFFQKLDSLNDNMWNIIEGLI